MLAILHSLTKYFTCTLINCYCVAIYCKPDLLVHSDVVYIVKAIRYEIFFIMKLAKDTLLIANRIPIYRWSFEDKGPKQAHGSSLLQLWNAFVMTSHKCCESCQCIVVARGTGQLPFGLLYPISFQYQSKLHITTVSSVVCNQGNHSMVIIKTTSLFLQLQGVWELKLTLHTLSHKIIAVSASHAEILSLVLHGYTYRKSNSLVLTTLGGQCLCLMPSLSYPTTHYDASGFYKPTDICLSSHFLVITTTCRWEQYSCYCQFFVYISFLVWACCHILLCFLPVFHKCFSQQQTTNHTRLNHCFITIGELIVCHAIRTGCTNNYSDVLRLVVTEIVKYLILAN